SFGVAALGSGAWLLYSTPVGTTAEALARLETQAAPLERGANVQRFAAAVPVAMRDGDAGLSMKRRSGAAEDFVVSVEVRAAVSGRVAAVRFESGSYVEKGETLFVLDPEPFAAAVAHAESTVAS